MSRESFVLEEIEVSLTISDGKLTAESRSGAKSGSLELTVEDASAELTLNSAGADRGTARLTGPELSSFRTNIDAGLSTLMSEEDTAAHDRRLLTSGYETLRPVDDGFATSIDSGALQSLGIVDADGTLPGGSRQVKCTVLNSGTAIIDLQNDGDSAFTF